LGNIERFLLPFEHRPIGAATFARAVAGLAVPMIDEAVSQAEAEGTAWPICLRDRLAAAIDRFVLPPAVGSRRGRPSHKSSRRSAGRSPTRPSPPIRCPASRGSIARWHPATV
jgi:hypothetical protein